MSRFKRIRSGLPGNPSFLITDLAHGDAVSWNSTTGKWDAAAPAAGVTDHGALTGLADDDHTQYHTDARALTWLQAQNATELDGTAHRTFYTDGSGNVTELAHGTSAQVLTSNGASSAPSWQAAGGGSSLVQFVDNSLVGEWNYNAIKVGASHANGFHIYNSAVPGTETFIGFHDNAGTREGFIMMGGVSHIIRVDVDSATFRIQGHTSASAQVDMLDLDPDGQTTLFTNGIEAMHTDTQNIGIHTNGTLTDPWLGAYHGAGEGTRQGFIQWGQTATTMRWNSEVHGAIMYINGENAVGTVKNGFTFDPDGTTLLGYAGTQVLEVDSLGANFARTSGTTSVNRMQNASFVNEGGLFSSPTACYIYTYTHGGLVQMWAENTAGTAKLVVSGNGDDKVELYYAGLVTAETSANGLYIRDPSASAPTMQFYNSSGVRHGFFQYGASNLAIRQEVHGGEIQLEAEDAGGTLRPRALRIGTASSAAALGFYDTAPVIRPASVAVTAAGIHAALVTLGLIT